MLVCGRANLLNIIEHSVTEYKYSRLSESKQKIDEVYGKWKKEF